jgi:hypothetical protein
MKRQTRPFIVEFKNRRGAAKQKRSIWGDIDLSVIAADAARESEKGQLPDRRLVDSNPAHPDADDGNKPQVELPMADLQQTEASQPLTEVPAKAEPVETKKKAPRQKRRQKRNRNARLQRRPPGQPSRNPSHLLPPRRLVRSIPRRNAPRSFRRSRSRSPGAPEAGAPLVRPGYPSRPIISGRRLRRPRQEAMS